MGTEEPPGRCFPARCGAAWGGYGAAWAAWGAPSRCPRTVRTSNSAFRVFTKQETRDTRPGYFQARGVSQREFRGFHETRDTKHETRLFFESRPFCRVGRPLMARRRQARRLQGGMYEARENEWKGVFLNPETGITTYTESGFGSRFGIPHYSSVFVAKIRISPCRQSSVPEHCGNREPRLHGCIASQPDLRWPTGLAKWRGEGRTGQESRNKAFDQARGASRPEFRGFHETRDTNHESRPFSCLLRPSGGEECRLE